MTQYRIRNWSRFQHYKDRNPPWIKLHVELLASEDWVMLADASKLLAVVCMVIAAKNDGMVPDNPDYIKRVAYLDKRPNLKPLVECGFLEIMQADASERKQNIAQARPETETETEQKEPSLRSGRAKVGLADLNAEDFRKLAEQEGRDAVRELANFRDWCAKHDKRFKDYPAAFRNWLRSEYGRQRDGPLVNGAAATEARLRRHFEGMGYGGHDEMGGGEVVPLPDAARLRGPEERRRQ